jgi:choline kinase
MKEDGPLGIILAAGRGSRMGPATRDKPKGLLELLGRPLIVWQVEALRAAGCSDVIAIGGYRWEMLKPLVEVRYINERWAETNMVSTLRCASAELSQRRCLVSYSDIVYHRHAPQALLATREDVAITYDRLWAELWRMRFDNPLDDAETFRVHAGQVVEIGAKPQTLEEVEGQYMGLISLTQNGWRNIEMLLDSFPENQIACLDMTSLLSMLLAAGIVIGAVPVDGKWVELDNVTDLKNYECRLDKESWSHDWR